MKIIFLTIAFAVMVGCSTKPPLHPRGELAFMLPLDVRFKQAKNCTKHQLDNWRAAGAKCSHVDHVLWLSNKIDIEDIESVAMMRYIIATNGAGCTNPI